MTGREGHEEWPPSVDQPRASDALARLWAPWRSAYITGDGGLEGCPFCVLAERPADRDRESLVLHRGTAGYLVFNAFPYNPGHLMAVPYAHVGELDELDADAATELWELTRRAVRAVRERLGCDGVNFGANFGSAAGAGVADHLHLHVVPRWVGDTNFVSVVGDTRIVSRDLADLYDVLAPAFPAPPVEDGS
jgi:ATP adenylyltransferase